MVGAGTWSPSANPAQHSAPGPGRMGGRAGPGMIAGGCTKAPSHGPVAGADGTYVVADAEQVTLRDARGTVRSRSGGSGFVIAPDGNQIAVYGRDAPRAGRAGAGHGDRAGHDFWHPPRLLRRLLAGRLGDRLREGSGPGRRRVRGDPGGQEGHADRQKHQRLLGLLLGRRQGPGVQRRGPSGRAGIVVTRFG